MQQWLISGTIATCISLVVYTSIYIYYRQSFFGMSVWDKLTYLISHVPDDRSAAWPHICAGVLFCAGVCLIGGTMIAGLPFVVKKFDQHATALTAGSLIFGVLISVISFWTLWQTKRIEQLQGANITGFKNLVAAITHEIERVNRDFLDHGNRASVGHRVLLATTNPYFGLLSFPDTIEERRFANAMCDAAKNVRSSANGNRKFQMRILCANADHVHSFNDDFFKKAEPAQSEDERKQATKTADERTEKFVSDLETYAADQVVKRQSAIPMLQFAVVGNVVFEFILLEPRTGASTGIAGARKIEDRLVCDRFCKHLDLLERLS